MNTGVKLWNQAKKIIPGGNQLLSKRSEMFLPEGWPAYYQKAAGAQIWDLDGRRYIDMSIMGMGTCVLGYSHPAVDGAVVRAIRAGGMSTLNCPEEVELARKLIALHPWAQMVRFARTGGEACAIAVRIARAALRKDKVAFCGYHGWSDWYLAANLADPENLNQQLLPGLEPLGVPQALGKTALPFTYGNLPQLQELLDQNKNEVGAIIMEVQRHKELDLEFLKNVRALADKIGAVLIFDEVTSGFRLRAGGMHVLYHLKPDMVVLGKAMGNGFPIAAVVGKEFVMKAAQDTFISSTFWSERVGFSAALEVIRQFAAKDVAEHLVATGNRIRTNLEKIFSSQKIQIKVVGMSPALCLIIQEPDPLVVKTVFTQEMLSRGFLAGGLIYVSLAHTPKIVDRYLKAAQEVFGLMAAAISRRRLNKMLKGPVCHGGFKRLN